MTSTTSNCEKQFHEALATSGLKANSKVPFTWEVHHAHYGFLGLVRYSPDQGDPWKHWNDNYPQGDFSKTPQEALTDLWERWLYYTGNDKRPPLTTCINLFYRPI